MSWSPDADWLVYLNPTDGWFHLVRIDGTEDIPWTEGGPTIAWRPTP